MDGITDEPTRFIQKTIGHPDVIFTEFVNVEHVPYRPEKILRNFIYSEVERPIVAQLSGHTPKLFYQMALAACYLGFDGIDINMGCPVKSVTRLGGGSKLIGNYDLVEEIVKAVYEATKSWKETIRIENVIEKQILLELNKIKDLNSQISNPYLCIDTPIHNEVPISIKTRIGIDEPITEKWVVFLAKLPINTIILHGRTLKQGYAGVANWEEIKKGSRIAHLEGKFCLGNGDIKSRKQAFEYSKKFGTDGVLIGRAALGNPWVFLDRSPTPEERLKTMLLHAQRFYDIFGNDRFLAMRKHFGWYPKGFGGAKELKAKLQKVSSFDEAKRVLASLEQ